MRTLAVLIFLTQPVLAQVQVPSYTAHEALEGRTTANERAIEALNERVRVLEENGTTPPPEPPAGDLDQLADLIADMGPNEWRELEDVHCRDVWLTSEDDATYSFRGRVQANWDAWVGGAFDGRHLYFGPGGGHNTRNSNVMYRLSLESLTCDRVAEPQPMLPEGASADEYRDGEGRHRSGGHPCVITWDTPDGKWVEGAHPAFPTGGHLQAGLLHVPRANAIFWHGSYQQCFGTTEFYTRGYWLLDLETRQWSWFLSPWASGSINAKARFSLDAEGNVVAYGQRYVYVLDPTQIQMVEDNYGVERPQHVVLRRSSRIGYDTNDGNVTPAVHPVSGLIYFFNYGGDLSTIDPTQDGDGLKPVIVARAGRDLPVWGYGYTTSMTVTPDRVWFWNGSIHIDAWNLTDATAVQWHSKQGIPVGGKPFNKLFWLPELQVFVAHHNPDRGLFVYKPAENLDVGDAYFPKRDVDPLPPDLYTVEGGASYATMPEALAAAQPGGTILIKRGNYHTCFNITKSVTVRGEDPNDRNATTIGTKICGNKGVILVSADNVTLEGFTVADVSPSSDLIRQQAENLTLRSMHLRDGGNGILSDYWLSDTQSETRVENSLFERLGGTHNGAPGYRHGVYLYGRKCGVINSEFREPKSGGHLVKARCRETSVLSSILDSSGGSGSRVIDVPNGGILVVRDSTLRSARTRGNPEAMAYGLEVSAEDIYPGTIDMSGNLWEQTLVSGNQGPFYLATRHITCETVVTDHLPWFCDWGLEGGGVVDE